MGRGLADTFTHKDIEVLYEDNHLLAINKPAGIAVQADDTGDKNLLDFVKDYITHKYDKPNGAFAGLIHRLDRPVSGVILFAKTSKALERFNKLFKTRQIQKTYWAIVKNQPPEPTGTIVGYLRKNPATNTSAILDTDADGGLLSELSYEIIARSSTYYLLEVNPITGRHHQIRVMLSSIGCPIRGDRKYGFQRSNPDWSINLHARKIAFIHPVKLTPLEITAPLPNEPIWEQMEF